MDENELNLDDVEYAAQMQYAKLVGVKIIRASFEDDDGTALNDLLDQYTPHEAFGGLLAIASVLVMETADDLQSTPKHVLDTLIQLMTSGQ